MISPWADLSKSYKYRKGLWFFHHNNYIHCTFVPTVHCLYRFPENTLNLKDGKERWKVLKQTVINSMCREARNNKIK